MSRKIYSVIIVSCGNKCFNVSIMAAIPRGRALFTHWFRIVASFVVMFISLSILSQHWSVVERDIRTFVRNTEGVRQFSLIEGNDNFFFFRSGLDEVG